MSVEKGVSHSLIFAYGARVGNVFLVRFMLGGVFVSQRESYAEYFLSLAEAFFISESDTEESTPPLIAIM